LPLEREGGCPAGDAERPPKGRDAEGSFQAGNLKFPVGFHGLSPLADRVFAGRQCFRPPQYAEALKAARDRIRVRL